MPDSLMRCPAILWRTNWSVQFTDPGGIKSVKIDHENDSHKRYLLNFMLVNSITFYSSGPAMHIHVKMNL